MLARFFSAQKLHEKKFNFFQHEVFERGIFCNENVAKKALQKSVAEFRSVR